MESRREAYLKKDTTLEMSFLFSLSLIHAFTRRLSKPIMRTTARLQEKKEMHPSEKGICTICLESGALMVQCRSAHGVFHSCMLPVRFCAPCFVRWIAVFRKACIFCREGTSLTVPFAQVYQEFSLVEYPRVSASDDVLVPTQERKEKETHDHPCPMKCNDCIPLPIGPMEKHLKTECIHRIMECPHCERAMTAFHYYEEHQQKCQRICCPLPGCDFHCSILLTKQEVEDPYYYPILFYQHFSSAHSAVLSYVQNHEACLTSFFPDKRYSCTFQDWNGRERCMFSFNGIRIQRFQMF